ncbi:MAG: hypothetical protein KDN05_18610 [Verrucomicrobiae bacterium]|nr:hypothetical protein [Verrucomicrobiae bacterium]MCP5532731.1 hypothetical protein [Akkermansiaceae bacterium]MCP5548717.1 hypothetical protein [Akkermansiaceae bacterium]
MWDIYQEMRLNDHRARIAETGASLRETSGDLGDLTQLVRKMALVNQALFELLKERTGLTDEDLRRKIKEVDLRDGKADGRLNAQTLRCPKCGGAVTAGALSCLTCGAMVAPKYPYEA